LIKQTGAPAGAATDTNLGGILSMVAAMFCFIANDTLLKLATEAMPPFESLFWRSAFAMLWGVPLVLVTRTVKDLPKIADRRVMFRSLVELVAVLGFVMGLANVSIADITAISQLAPIFVVIGAAVFLKTRVTQLQLGLAALAFVGALMVVQPGGATFSVFALFGLWNALMIAVRDLGGSRIGAHIPGSVVAVGAALSVLIGTAIIGPVFEDWIWPDARALAIIAGSGMFLMGGHYFVFLAFRLATPGAVAPFFYSSTIWALISAFVIFGTIPNALALGGIAVIVTSGVIVVAREGRKKRRAVAERMQPPAN